MNLMSSIHIIDNTFYIKPWHIVKLTTLDEISGYLCHDCFVSDLLLSYSHYRYESVITVTGVSLPLQCIFNIFFKQHVIFLVHIKEK